MSAKKKKVLEYPNDDITIVWKPDLCIHSAKCVHGLPGVFDPNKRPWINAGGADSESIMAVVDKCPSGALSYYKNDAPQEEEIPQTEQNVEVLKDGPLLVHGRIKVKSADGSEKAHEKVTAFCRCGASKNKPYCDGGHKKIGFEG